ncbi:MAG: glycosyltransferase [Thermodesulfobacteriota bacterium]|nr:glycosyltransferase [Thermodesulfobacteriota bacterium]
MLEENKLVPYSVSEIPRGTYLIFAPHPDDETFGMGGTIALAVSAQIDVDVVFVTNGGRGGDPDTRVRESKKAAGILGIRNLFYLNLPDRQVHNTWFPEDQITDIINTSDPLTIFLPSFQEFHPDHRAVNHKVLCFLNKKRLGFDLWFYEINRQGEVNRLIDISSVVEKKEEAVVCYKSQLDQLDYQSLSLCLNFSRSITLDRQIMYAEGFWQHDPDSNMTPDVLYFNKINAYRTCRSFFMHQSNPFGRILRDHKKLVKALWVQMKESKALSWAIAKGFNEKVQEIETLRSQLSQSKEKIKRLSDELSDIFHSRAHKAAFQYIRIAARLKSLVFQCRCFPLIKKKMLICSIFLKKKRKYADRQKVAPLSVSEKSEDPEKSENLTRPSPLLYLPDNYMPAVRVVFEDSCEKPMSDFSMSAENAGLFMETPFFLDMNAPVVFRLQSDMECFNGIKLLAAACQRINPGVIILNLYEDHQNTGFLENNTDFPDSDGRDGHDNILDSVLNQSALRTTRIQAPELIDNRFVLFAFDSVTYAQDRPFLITLEIENGREEERPGFWMYQPAGTQGRQVYEKWIEKTEAETRAGSEETAGLIENFSYQPDFSVLLPINSHDPAEAVDCLYATIKSLMDQVYPFWRLAVLLDDSIDEHTISRIKQYTENETRIILYTEIQPSAFALSMNQAIDSADQEFVLTVDCGDVLADHALYEAASLLNQNREMDILYSDEDKMSLTSRRKDPFFKPDWSPDLLLSCMYMGSFFILRKNLLKDIGGFDQNFIVCRDYDLALKCTERTARIAHIAKILYHRRDVGRISAHLTHSGSFAKDCAEKALALALDRRGIDGYIHQGRTGKSFQVKRRIREQKRISIIIPFRDDPEVLEACVESVLEKTEYPSYEIICVNNQSVKKKTFSLMEILKQIPGVFVIHYDSTFNYSAINNFAALRAKGDVFVFLNSDTEVISPGWLSAMLEHGVREEVGAVGARLYYINDSIQHAGIVLGISGVAGHAFKHVSRWDTDYYHGFPLMIRNVSAVTGACMMVRREVFEALGGFDESDFKISYNDIDFCLTARQKGYEIIYTPFAELYHYESYSRGYSLDRATAEKMVEKWQVTVKKDPYYNSNLTLTREDWALIQD